MYFLAADHQVKEISKSYTAACLTLRGDPPSDFPEDINAYTLPTVDPDFLALLTHFKTEKAVIGSDDFGSTAAQIFALIHPKRILRLMVINSPLIHLFDNLVKSDE